MLVPGALPEFPDSSGSGKGRSCPGGSGNGIFLLQSSFHSRCFLRGSFPHRFFRQPYQPAAISRKSSVLFSFLGVPFSHLMICFEAPLAAPRGLFSGGISPRARRKSRLDYALDAGVKARERRQEAFSEHKTMILRYAAKADFRPAWNRKSILFCSHACSGVGNLRLRLPCDYYTTILSQKESPAHKKAPGAF